MAFFETSAFNDINVDEAFQRISKEVFQRLETTPVGSGPGATKAVMSGGPKSISSAQFNEPPKKKGGWCTLL